MNAPIKPTQDVPFKESNKWMHQIGGAIATINVILMVEDDVSYMVSFPDTKQGCVDAKGYYLGECKRLGAQKEDLEILYDDGVFTDDDGSFKLFYISSTAVLKGKPRLRK